MLIILILLTLLIPYSSYSYNVVGWYVSNGRNADLHFPPEELAWNIYTHIKTGDPKVFPNGTAICDPSDIITPRIVKIAKQKDVKVLWGLGLDINPAKPNKTRMNNYLQSIRIAAKECNIDGIEVDYEWHNNNWGKMGIILPKLSTRYTQFLKNLKIALGPTSVVSADVTGWGVYLFGIYPWINVTMLNNGDFDFINVMSYYWSEDGSLFRWEKDIELIRKWNIDPSRVNIGIPYFSMNKTIFKLYGEPSWKSLSSKCPNIDPDLNKCNDILIVGKKMNQKIGELIRKNKFGGAFPWAANYDSVEYNNSLIQWLYRGLNS